MITERSFTEQDIPALTASLENDAFHRGTFPSFFTEGKTVCNVYEDEQGPILYLRGAKTLRLDVLFSSDDEQRNRSVLDAVENLLQRAAEQGFVETIVRTDSPVLTKLAVECGFTASQGELRKAL